MSDRNRQGGQFPADESPGLRRGSALPRGSAARPAVMPEPYRYTIDDLVERANVTSRTIRFYIQEGLLPPATGRGPSATYGPSHLIRLQAIAQMKEQRRPLAEIRERLLAMSDEALSDLLELQSDPAPAEELWRRVSIHPDLELLVRVRRGRSSEALDQFVRRVALLARDQFDGDLP
jgi:DNA-binding transcriptional MerR regulator